MRKLFAPHLDLPASSALVIDDSLSGVPVALVPALDADHEHVLVPESERGSRRPGPLPVLADIVRCSVRDDVRGSASLPRAFAPAQHAYTVCVLPAGGLSPCLPDDVCVAIGVPSGAPLPRLVSRDLRRPGSVCAYAHESRHPGGCVFCVLVIYVFEVVVRGEPTRSALEGLFHVCVAPGDTCV